MKNINKDKSILIVEDDFDVLNSIKEFFSMMDYKVYQAANGKEAVEFLNDNKPGLILSDRMMPEMDGMDLLRHVKSQSSTSEIPFVFLSAVVDREEIGNAKRLGADYYLPKPFRLKELFNVIESFFLTKN